MPQFAASFLRLTALFLCRTPSFRTTSSPFVLTKRAPVFSICTTDGQKLPTFLKKSTCFARKSPTFCNNKGRCYGRETQKKDCTPIHCTVLLYFNPNSRRAAYIFGRSSLRSPGSRIVSLVDGFLCSAFCSSFGLLFHGFCTGCRRALHLATASLGFLSGTLRAILSSRFGLGGSFAGSFLAFSAGLLALGGLFCGAIGSLLPLGAGFLCVLFAARFHFLLSGFSVYLHHLCGSGGTYGEYGGESQTAEEGVELELHNRVVVWFCLCFGVSFVKTHEVIFLQTSDFSRLQLQM